MFRCLKLSLLVTLLLSFFLISTEFAYADTPQERGCLSNETAQLDEPAITTAPVAHPWPESGYDAQNTNRCPHDTSENTGKVLWSTPDSGENQIPGEIIWHCSPVIAKDGTIYVASDDDDSVYLSAINRDGTKKWSTPASGENHLPGDSVWASPSIGADGTVYVGSHHHDDEMAFLSALNPDGTRKWSTPGSGENGLAGDMIQSSPRLSSDGSIYIGTFDMIKEQAFLNAMNPDGTKKWSTPTSGEDRLPGNRVLSTASIGADGTIYIGSHGDESAYLTAINPDGTKKWSTPDSGRDQIPGRVVDSSPAVSVDGTIYIGSYDDDGRAYLSAINPDGSKKWSTPSLGKDQLPGGTLGGSAALGEDGTIYIVSTDDVNYEAYLTAINPDGTVKWSSSHSKESKIPGTGTWSSAVIAGDGTIYVGSYDFRLREVYLTAINDDGTKRWSTHGSKDGTIAGSATWSTPAIDQNGTVYVTSFTSSFDAVFLTAIK